MTVPNENASHKKTLEEQELEFRRAQLAVEFAKFGFHGTKQGALAGMLLVLALAITDAISSEFTFGTTGVLGVSMLVAVAVLGMGAFSLWQPVKILARFGEMSLGVESDPNKSTTDPPSPNMELSATKE